VCADLDEIVAQFDTWDRDRSRRLLVCVGLVAIAVIGFGALNLVLAHRDASKAERARTLPDVARALVPPTAILVGEGESECGPSRSSHTCVTIALGWSGSFAARFTAASETLRKGGWKSTSEPSFVYERGDLQADLNISRRGSWWNKHCARKTLAALDQYYRARCFDTIDIQMR
jgi:hypothetical protein